LDPGGIVVDGHRCLGGAARESSLLLELGRLCHTGPFVSTIAWFSEMISDIRRWRKSGLGAGLGADTGGCKVAPEGEVELRTSPLSASSRYERAGWNLGL